MNSEQKLRDYFLNDLMKCDLFALKFTEKELAEIFDYFSKQYNDECRTYHNFDHINDCIEWLHKLEVNDPVIELALFFHDCENSELMSAFKAHELLQIGFCYGRTDMKTLQSIVQLILETDHKLDHYCFTEENQSLMVSVDLAILGSEPQKYMEYVSKVKEEYRRKFKNLDDTSFEWMWLYGRARFLQTMLAREFIIPHKKIREMLEKQAVSNMRGELYNMGCKE